MPPYSEKYPLGSDVRIAGRQCLEDFRHSWRYHHPLQEIQLEYAELDATVEEVSFYHGGDVLYRLISIPGIWHECCLESNKGQPHI